MTNTKLRSSDGPFFNLMPGRQDPRVLIHNMGLGGLATQIWLVPLPKWGPYYSQTLPITQNYRYFFHRMKKAMYPLVN
jgi:hypothetical protein